MDLRRVVLGALIVCSLVGSAATLVGPPGTEPRSDSVTARSTPIPNATATDRACPPRAAESAVPTERQTEASAGPQIVGLYPNPTTDGNVGEFAVLEVPPGTALANWTLTDGHTTATLPNETASGRVAVSTAPNVTESLTDAPVLALDGHLKLAADGDELRLRNGTTTIDAVAYDRAPTAERWYRTEPATDADGPAGTASPGDPDHGRGQWWPRDATCLPVSTADVDQATAFVLPDSPQVPRETIRDADDRLLLAGYTVTSEPIAAALANAAERGVDVAVLLEASPVGGTPAPTADVIETLEAAGVDVRAVGGDGARYRYHHPKYAVADDRVLVTTENWKPAGVGGESSRGWGVRFEDERLADELVRVFRADFEGPDTVAGDDYRATTSFVDDESADLSATEFPTTHEPDPVPVESAELLVAPDNAERRLQALLAAADDEILIVQPTVAADVSLLESTLDAARRGVDVRLLLGSAWYDADDNEALAADLERVADREELSISVRLVDDTDRFEKIHAKGIVIDREIAVVGSANWNSNSLENNREVLVALHGRDVAGYYADVFEADWAGDQQRFPIGLGVAVIVALAAAALVGRRYVRFDDRDP
ncbi:phospholipase D-like domain-containing protein [Natrinema salifodinae]|uniref:Phosphatidylserine/phosphatidylglycerophosphate/cardiolipin synthase n=1 Tax=Natrinema salifodinae TaxID=1202768 RepID=A0A1I0NIB6_9EURY|nr:phospholipase D-like domain-containing protein [Natrinema salifodinae]SEW01035.1 Phosphatidylserine/phosphatidylglycerophosphate/cardiolipin synthase [Natrinema salifodinae]